MSICNHKHLGQQNSVAWHDLLAGEISSQYIEMISQQGAYKDHFVLQAIAEHFNVKLLVASTLNSGTIWIALNGLSIFLLMPINLCWSTLLRVKKIIIFHWISFLMLPATLCIAALKYLWQLITPTLQQNAKPNSLFEQVYWVLKHLLLQSTLVLRISVR